MKLIIMDRPLKNNIFYSFKVFAKQTCLQSFV